MNSGDARELDVNFYRSVYPDLVHLTEKQARRHWERVGMREGRLPCAAAVHEAMDLDETGADFDPVVYLALNPDLEPAGITSDDAAAFHFLTTGRMEGRPYRISLEGPPQLLPVSKSRPSLSGIAPSEPGWRELPWSARQTFDDSLGIAQVVLGRAVGPDEGVPTHVRDTLGDLAYVEVLVNSEEFQQPEEFLASLSSPEFAVMLMQMTQGRLPDSAELDHLVTSLDYATQSRSRMLLHFATNAMKRNADASAQQADLPGVASEPSEEILRSRLSFSLLGTPQMVSARDWDERVRQTRLSQRGTDAGRRTRPLPAVPGPVARTNADGPRVGVLTSIFRGDRFLDMFIDDLSAQTIFDQVEVCIISVDPSDFERHALESWAARCPNVRVIFEPRRIGIYQAWNIAIESTTAPYLTNANVDDMRRTDSLEVQADSLDRHDWVDVVYQDVLYTLDRTMSFEEVEEIGFITQLPHVTAVSLLSGVNAPHNAPMWRRRLHEDLGLFDETFQTAGDYEFWVRCATSGKTFLKTRDPHVAYFVNPEGLSTRPGGRGVEEAGLVLQRYWSALDYGVMPGFAVEPRLVDAAEPRAERVTRGAIARGLELRRSGPSR